MELDHTQLAELCVVSPDAQVATEGGTTFVLLPGFTLPTGVVPSTMDLLLCPSLREGYQSRLFFAARVAREGRALNWNAATCVLGRPWEAFSWRTPAGLRYAQMLSAHLDALR